MISANRRYISGFDGLRAIAVLAVILYHFNPTAFKGGFLGVPIFMGISGYLITDHLLDEYQLTGHFDYLKFWKKRIRRLYPTLVTMLIGTSAYIFLFARNLLYQLWQIVLANLLYIYNWWQIIHRQSYFQQFAGTESPFTHLWTLSIEGQFYLLWPLLVVCLLKIFSQQRIIFYTALSLSLISACLMLIFYVPQADPSRVYYGTDTRMFSILFGSALAVVWPSRRLSKNVAWKQRLVLEITGTLAFGGMSLFLLNANGQSNFIYQGGMILFSLLVTLMLAVVAQPASIWGKLLTNPFFSWIGSRSYAIYVYQFPVMVFFEAKFTNLAGHPILYPIIETMIILLISEFSYRLIEKPVSRINQADLQNKVMGIIKYIPWQGSKKSSLNKSAIITLIIGLLGVSGLINSVFVTKSAAQHSELAQKLAKNRHNQNQQNSQLKRLTKSAKENSTAASSEHPSKIATQFEKYGLSQAQLKVAQALPLTAVGDSVMLAGQPELSKIFPKMYINAVVGRQADMAAPCLNNLKKENLLAKNVLIGLGTNGPIQPADLQAIMQTIGNKRKVYWINVRVPSKSWQNQVNAFLAAAAKKYPNLKIINWYKYANDQPSWFYQDQTHPNNLGEVYYASFVAHNILTD